MPTITHFSADPSYTPTEDEMLERIKRSKQIGVIVGEETECTPFYTLDELFDQIGYYDDLSEDSDSEKEE